MKTIGLYLTASLLISCYIPSLAQKDSTKTTSVGIFANAGEPFGELPEMDYIRKEVSYNPYYYGNQASNTGKYLAFSYQFGALYQQSLRENLWFSAGISYRHINETIGTSPDAFNFDESDFLYFQTSNSENGIYFYKVYGIKNIIHQITLPLEISIRLYRAYYNSIEIYLKTGVEPTFSINSNKNVYFKNLDMEANEEKILGFFNEPDSFALKANLLGIGIKIGDSDKIHGIFEVMNSAYIGKNFQLGLSSAHSESNVKLAVFYPLNAF